MIPTIRPEVISAGGAKPRAKLFDMASTPKWKATILQRLGAVCALGLSVQGFSRV